MRKSISDMSASSSSAKVVAIGATVLQLSPPPRLLDWDSVQRDIHLLATEWRAGRSPNFVPPAWTEAALALDDGDAQARGYIARINSARGRVTIQHALFFVALEQKARDALPARAKRLVS